MCNTLKNGNRVYKIPAEGIGYKVFVKRDNVLYSAVHNTVMPLGKWIKWKAKLKPYADGFCFLPNKTAIKGFGVQKDRGEVLHKIEYKKGLGKRHDVYNMSALCKEYKILEEVTL